MNDHTTYLTALFPRWKVTPELLKLVDRDFDRARINDEQVRAIIDQHRRERKGNDPDLATIAQRIANAVAQAAYRPPSVELAPAPTEGELHPLGHWFRHYAKPENRRKLDAETLAALEHHENNKAARATLLRGFAPVKEAV